MRGADPTRYGTLIADLSNQYAMGIDNYPVDITSAYSLLVNYRTPDQRPCPHQLWLQNLNILTPTVSCRSKRNDLCTAWRGGRNKRCDPQRNHMLPLPKHGPLCKRLPYRSQRSRHWHNVGPVCLHAHPNRMQPPLTPDWILLDSTVNYLGF
jgi:hypothetical protein